MGVRTFLLQENTLVDAGKWETGKMTRGAFPLTKNNSLRLGTGWVWRVVRVKYGGEVCRILIALHEEKQNAFAYIGIETNGDTRVICMLEQHSTHSGWHVHASCDHKDAPLGRLRWPALRRIPRKTSFHKPISGLLTKDLVLARAMRTFRTVVGAEIFNG
jgi:hypothetical protein